MHLNLAIALNPSRHYEERLRDVVIRISLYTFRIRYANKERIATTSLRTGLAMTQEILRQRKKAARSFDRAVLGNIS